MSEKWQGTMPFFRQRQSPSTHCGKISIRTTDELASSKIAVKSYFDILIYPLNEIRILKIKWTFFSHCQFLAVESKLSTSVWLRVTYRKVTFFVWLPVVLKCICMSCNILYNCFVLSKYSSVMIWGDGWTCVIVKYRKLVPLFGLKVWCKWEVLLFSSVAQITLPELNLMLRFLEPI